MKQTLKHYGPVAALLAFILVASTLLTQFCGGGPVAARRQVLVTTYPLYVAAQNILGATDTVQVTMLSGAGAGCLHEYQLSPADRLAIERAERVIANGVGAEPFLEGLVTEARLVDTSCCLEELICAEQHHDHHDHDHEHEHSDTAYNEHVWVSPAYYAQQVQQVTNALMELDPENEAVYLANGTAYEAAIRGLAAELPALSGRPCVIFHDSLSYLAKDLGLTVTLTLNSGEESGISAADLAQVERLAVEHPDLIVLYDTQYPLRYTAVDGLVPAAQVLALETGVTGDGKPSDWLDAMTRNVEKLKQLTKGG